MGTTREFFEKFCAEHGEYEQVDDGRLFVFEDGAFFENSITGMGLSCGPPKKEYELQAAILRFREARLAKAVQAYDEAYRAAMKDDYAFMRQDKILPELTRLEAEVAKWKRFVDATRRRKNRADPNWISPEQRIEDAKRREQLAEKRNAFQAKVKKIQV